MFSQPPVAIILANLDITFQCYHHPNSPESIDQVAIERGQTPDQIIRSIFFRRPQKMFVMVLTAGNKWISWSKLRTYLGTTRLRLATADEVLEVTGYPIGAVSPIGVTKLSRLLADKNVFIPDEISLGSGTKNIAIIMKSQDLKIFLSTMEIGDFSE